MWGAIKYNLANLTNFNGRDARQTFWYYVLFLVVVQFALGIIMVIPLYVDMFTQAFNAARSGMDEAQMQAMMFSDVADQMKTQMMVSAVLSLVIVVMLLASFVRRLHDSGKPGWWAAIPAATYIFAAIYNFMNVENIIAVMQEAMTSGNPAAAYSMQGEMAGWSIISWIGIIVVIVFGVMKSDEGANGYGDAPVRF